MEAKIKRCKHGRIIVKDMSRKKRSVQQSDKEINKKINNINNNDNNSIINNNSNNVQATTVVIEQVSEKTHSIEQSANLSTNSSKQSHLNDDNHLSKSKRITGTQDYHNSQHHQKSDQLLEHKTNFLSKTAQHEASPRKQATARSTNQSPLSNNSASSDIYDPEGPVIPMSPVDSPPLSPFDDAANSNLPYHLDDDKANDDDVPSSAVQLNQQEKYLQKLNRQERAIEEVKVALKPHYQKRSINKEQYKDVLRRAVPKVRYL